MSDRNFPQTILKLIDALTTAENYDALIQILGLLCIFSLTSRPTGKQPKLINDVPESPLQKLLGDFSKGAPPDMLTSLLPLLANPQLKSKLNPNNLSSIIGMINNLTGGLKPPARPEEASAASSSKPEPPIKTTVQTAPAEMPPALPEAPPDTPAEPPRPSEPAQEQVRPTAGQRHLNWKTNF